MPTGKRSCNFYSLQVAAGSRGKCAIEYDEVMAKVKQGAADLFPPDCDDNGNYAPVQCMHWPLNNCYCVDVMTGATLYDSFNWGTSDPKCDRKYLNLTISM